eukprot:13164073-Alexandrium_andersonii.AAC.1
MHAAARDSSTTAQSNLDGAPPRRLRRVGPSTRGHQPAADCPAVDCRGHRGISVIPWVAKVVIEVPSRNERASPLRGAVEAGSEGGVRVDGE